MFRKCYEEEDYKPAIGIAIEAKRLDVVEEGIKLAGSRHQKLVAAGDTRETDMAVELMEYVLDIAMVEVEEISLRESVGIRAWIMQRCANIVIASPYACHPLHLALHPRLLLHQQMRYSPQ